MKTLFKLFAILFVTFTFAQESNSWKISAGINIVDIRTPDNFSGVLKDYLNGKIEDLNMYNFPIRIAVEAPLTNHLSLQLSGSKNEIRKGFNYL